MTVGQVFLWARMPPPRGGVTRANELMRDTLSQRFDVVVVDGSIGEVLRALAKLALSLRPHLHVIKMSRPDRVIALAPIVLLFGRRCLVVIHGAGGVEDLVRRRRTLWAKLLVRLLRRAGEVWVDNESVAASLGTVSVAATVVSPWAHTVIAAPPRHSRDEYRLVVAEYNNASLYNVELVVDLAERLIHKGIPARVLLLSYGPWARARDVPGFVEQVVNGDDAAVRRALAWANLLVRPTSTDGDSGFVREAIATGVRVVASDCVPRPAGVELFSIAGGDLFDVVVGMGRISDGTGLGAPLQRELARFIETGRRHPVRGI
jgi:glycosyltransferase involved in cell wall biosynthesis